MDDHKSRDAESKKKRHISRRTQLRNLDKSIKMLHKLNRLLCHEKIQWIDRYRELEKRLTETQKLLPFWIRKVP
jgi:hypothetical protein